MRTTLRVLAVALLVAIAGPAAAQRCGDADGNGAVDGADARQVLRAAAGVGGSCPVARCDADGDGAITDTDGVRVLRRAAGASADLLCPGAGSRRPMLAGLAAVVIVPSYRDLAAAATALRTAIDALIASPGGATLAGAQGAWRAVHVAWKRTEAFRLGPSERLRTAARIDWQLVRSDRIDEEIGGSASFTPSYLASLGADKVGMHAIEYLLFSPEGGDAAILASLGGARRREYLAALATDVESRARELRDAWEPSQGNFGADLAASGNGPTTFATLKDAVDELINRIVFTTEMLEETQLGDPLGIGRSGGPKPELLESWRSGNSKVDALATLDGVRGVHLGTYRGFVGASVSEVTTTASDDVDTAVRARIAAADAVLAGLVPPLSVALVERFAEVEQAYRTVQALRRSLVLDLAPALGVTLTFGGTDGD